MNLLFPKVLLLLLSVWGFWTLWSFPYTNGMLKILKDLSSPGASIPGPTWAPMKQRFTGIKFVDTQLTTLSAFFYTAVDGNRADVSLSGLDLGGSVVAAWMLMTIESVRAGNRGKIFVTSITTLGLLLQNIGFACIAPIWMAIHLSTSKTVIEPRDFNLIATQPLQLALAPISVALGYGIPSVMMCLPAPKLISFDTKVTWCAVQQGWPIWIALTQGLLNILVNVAKPDVSIMSEADKKAKTITYLRRIYAFAIVSSATGHLVSGGIALLAYAFPVLFSPKYLPMLQPAQIFKPVAPFGTRQARDLAEGALWFLQWDLYTGVASVLVWALTLRIAAKNEVATPLQWVVGMARVGVIAGMLGGAGAAVVAVWSRDELVFRTAALQEEAGRSRRPHNE